MADIKTEGRLDRARGRIRSTWGDLTVDDLDRSQGNLEMLVGRIKERTGEATESIREKLQKLLGNDEREDPAP